MMNIDNATKLSSSSTTLLNDAKTKANKTKIAVQAVRENFSLSPERRDAQARDLKNKTADELRTVYQKSKVLADRARLHDQFYSSKEFMLSSYADKASSSDRAVWQRDYRAMSPEILRLTLLNAIDHEKYGQVYEVMRAVQTRQNAGEKTLAADINLDIALQTVEFPEAVEARIAFAHTVADAAEIEFAILDVLESATPVDKINAGRARQAAWKLEGKEPPSSPPQEPSPEFAARLTENVSVL